MKDTEARRKLLRQLHSEKLSKYHEEIADVNARIDADTVLNELNAMIEEVIQAQDDEVASKIAEAQDAWNRQCRVSDGLEKPTSAVTEKYVFPPEIINEQDAKKALLAAQAISIDQLLGSIVKTKLQ